MSRHAAFKILMALLLLVGVPNLGSEGFKLTTFYPAPSGVYTKMIVTGGTILARDGGGVLIGTAVSVPGIKLSVFGGTSNANFGGITGGWNAIWLNGSSGTGDYNVRSSLATPDLFFNRPLGSDIEFHEGDGTAQMVIKAGGNVGLGGPTPTAALDLIPTTSQLITRQAGCLVTSYNHLGNTPCGVGFATYVAGLMTNYQGSHEAVVGSAGSGTMLCCPCPPGGCGAF